MTTNALLDWFDQLETVLEEEAKLCGLLNHSATVGQAREFLVARVLRSILPPGVHIGTGKVIDHQGASSKQIDIVIYDPRFSLLKVEGGGLYFVEGVLATIEVKSILDADQLVLGLGNCASVLELNVNGEHPEEAAARVAFYADRGGITDGEAKDRFHYMLHPATYIFAFTSKLSSKTTLSRVEDWWKGIGYPVSPHFPLLPRLIATGNSVGVTNDGWLTISAASSDGSPLKRQDGTPARTVMNCFPTDRRFRWFALHIMNSVSSRMGLRNHAERFDYRISSYFPMDAYIEAIRGQSATSILA